MTRLSRHWLAASLAVFTIASGASPVLAVTSHHHHRHHHHHHVVTTHHRAVAHHGAHHALHGHHAASTKTRQPAKSQTHVHAKASASHPSADGKRHAALCQQVMVHQHWTQHCR